MNNGNLEERFEEYNLKPIDFFDEYYERFSSLKSGKLWKYLHEPQSPFNSKRMITSIPVIILINCALVWLGLFKEWWYTIPSFIFTMLVFYIWYRVSRKIFLRQIRKSIDVLSDLRSFKPTPDQITRVRAVSRWFKVGIAVSSNKNGEVLVVFAGVSSKVYFLKDLTRL